MYLTAGNRPKYKHRSSFMTLGKVVCQDIILIEDTFNNFLPWSFHDLHLMISINGWGVLSCHGHDSQG